MRKEEKIVLQLTDKALAEVELAFNSVEELEKILGECEKTGYLTEERKPDGRVEQVFRLVCREHGFALKAIPQPPDQRHRKLYYLVVDLWFPSKDDAYQAWAHPLEATLKLLRPFKRRCRFCGRELRRKDRYCDGCGAKAGPSKFGLTIRRKALTAETFRSQLKEPADAVLKACERNYKAAELPTGYIVLVFKVKPNCAISREELKRLDTAFRASGAGYVMPRDELRLAEEKLFKPSVTDFRFSQ